MSKEQKSNFSRLYLAALPFGLVALGVLVQLIRIQFGEGPDLRAKAEEDIIKEMPIAADRGNIYSADGHLLATTMPVYNIHFDPLAPEQDTFNAYLQSLASELATLRKNRTADQWYTYLNRGRKLGNRYLPIASDLTFSELQEYKALTLFKRGKYRGGIIIEQENHRKMPLGKVAERTIGRDRRYSSTGLEGAFSELLRGRDGKRLKQKLSGNNFKPITGSYQVEPEDGYDIRTTINARFQDVVHHELLAALEHFEADHGCAVLMETKTGAIRAIANLGRTAEGRYFEKRNYAVWESTEPGSTFKLASVMCALEDGVADVNTVVDTKNGQYEIFGRKITDSNNKGYGKITLQRAFEVSSNVGVVKLIYEHYRDQPELFVDRLYNIGLDKPLELPIRGEGLPSIPKPGDERWSGLSLPWMAFGYQVSFTPLQILSFYNAVANNGVMVKPQFVSEIRQHGRLVEKRVPEIINPAICSKNTLSKLQAMLRGAVDSGTAANIDTMSLNLAGKTGTCQLNYWRASSNDYQASFVGYFPAEAPRYSCIVVINKPNYHRGYYGSTVAAPVFAAIAQKVHVATPQKLKSYPIPVEPDPETKTATIPKEGTMPNLIGKDAYKVLSTLENAGYRVSCRGAGKINWQYPPAGAEVNKDQLIELKM